MRLHITKQAFFEALAYYLILEVGYAIERWAIRESRKADEAFAWRRAQKLG